MFFSNKFKYAIIGENTYAGILAASLKKIKKDVTFIAKTKEFVENYTKQGGMHLALDGKYDKLFQIEMTDIESVGEIEADVVFVCVEVNELERVIPVIEKISKEEALIFPIVNTLFASSRFQEQINEISEKKLGVVDVFMIAILKQPDKSLPVYVLKNPFLELRFSRLYNKSINMGKIKAISADIRKTGIQCWVTPEDWINQALIERLFITSSLKCCCSYFDITPAEIKDEKFEFMKQLCEEIALLSKNLFGKFDEVFLNNYYECFDENTNIKKQDLPTFFGVDSCIFETDEESLNLNAVIYYNLFMLVELANNLGLELSAFHKVAEKFKECDRPYFKLKIEKMPQIGPKIYCSNIISTLSFHQKYVGFCTTLENGPSLTDYNDSPEKIINDVIVNRDRYVEDIRNDVIPEKCKDCKWRLEEPVKDDLIKRIDLFYWYHCNCGCFYCSYINDTKGKFSDTVKPGNPVIYQIIEKLYKENRIDRENLLVIWGGGEIAVLEEFPKLIDLFLKQGVSSISVESSGIKYSKAVGKILKKNKGAITIAICSGTPETYKRIKRRDKYNTVVENMKKYLKDARKNKYLVVSKFIILNKFNDNIEEVEKWLQMCYSIGIEKVEISMEFCWGEKRKKGQPVEEYNYEIFKYVEKRTRELGLILIKNPTSVKLMNAGIY